LSSRVIGGRAPANDLLGDLHQYLRFESHHLHSICQYSTD